MEQHLNRTHDAKRKSWIESANLPGSDFPIQNLPFGVFSTTGADRHIGVAIGDKILDLTALEMAGALTPGRDRRVFNEGVLNPFMALHHTVWSETRAEISDMLDYSQENRDLPLFAMSNCELHLPFFVRSYTDFYASKEHATNVGSMFRDPENALMPNWLHIPIGYNGRASTVVVSGTGIVRPLGQIKGPNDVTPRFAASAKLDIELELGAVVGTPNPMGTRVSTATAYSNIFGYVLLNDWSARDIQTWEYQPLGPFQSKAFGTSISPWVVTREALEPFRVSPPAREVPLLPYLEETSPNNFDIDLKVELHTSAGNSALICETNYKYMYYSAAQQLAHHSSSGCSLETGDLLGSGTISGPINGSFGSLLELTTNGQNPLSIGTEQRSFLEDGDRVLINGVCRGEYRIGFGCCEGQILSADRSVVL